MDNRLSAAGVLLMLPPRFAAQVNGRLFTCERKMLAQILPESVSQFSGEWRRLSGLSFLLTLQDRTTYFPIALNRAALVHLWETFPRAFLGLLLEWLGMARTPLYPRQAAAVLLVSLPSDQSAAIVEAMDDSVQTILAGEIPRLPMSEELLSTEVRAEFCRIFLVEDLDQRVRQDPVGVAALLDRWLCQGGPTEVSFPYTALSVKSILTPRQCASVLLMSLPPELSAQLFRALGPDSLELITSEISKLPQIQPELREAVLAEFCRNSDVASLEEAAQASPVLLSQQLAEWGELGDEGAPEEGHTLPFGPHLDLVCGPSLSPWLQSSEVVEQILALREDLTLAWSRALPVAALRESPSQTDCYLALRWKGKVLRRFLLVPGKVLVHRPQQTPRWQSEVPVGLRFESDVEVLLREMSQVFRNLGETIHEQDKVQLPLSPDGLAAMGAFRAFHPNQMAEALRTLSTVDLSRVASGLVEFLHMTDKDFQDAFRLSLSYSPREILAQTGLAAPEADYVTIDKIALLFTAVPLEGPGKTVIRELLALLTSREAVILTEKMVCLVLRRDEGGLKRREVERVLGQFAEWRYFLHCRPGAPVSLSNSDWADRIPHVWPKLSLRRVRQELQQLATGRPRALAELVRRFWRESSGPPWIPTMIRAAHFVNGLEDPKRIRHQLSERGYVLPDLAFSATATARAQKEWEGRAFSVTLN